MLLEGGSDPAKRIQYGFRLVTGRSPAAKELAILRELAKQQTTEYDRNPQTAAKLVTVGESAPDPALDKVVLAAWTTIASAMLNLDETITKE